MNYLNTETGQYPISEREIRALHANVSFPEPFAAPEPFAPVFAAPAPEHDPITQGVREIAPSLTGKGHYEQRWEVYPLDAETVAANRAREAARIRREIMDGVQRYLDDFATTKTYDSMLSACTYATSTVPKFQREGQYCVEKRDECWATVARIEAEVLAGTRPAPTGFDDIRGELPVLEWPQ